MQALVAILLPIIVIVAIAAIVLLVVERFSPDATVTKIVQWIVFALVLYVIISRLLPLIH